MQISPNLPLYAKLLPTGAISSRVLREGPASDICLQLVIRLDNHCISYFIFCILTFECYIMAIYACSGSGSLSCYQIALKYAKLLYISQRRFSFFAINSFIVNFLFSTLLWFVQNCIVLMFCVATNNHKEP